MTPVEDQVVKVGQRQFSWAIAWFGGLLLGCYAPVLWVLATVWDEHPAWQKRDELRAQEASPNWWGLAVVLLGGLQLYLATLGVEVFLARTSFVVSLIGVVLLLGGTRYLRILSFPLFLLSSMAPIPAVIYNRITFPLQILASEGADRVLGFLSTTVLREGNILHLADKTLSVVEACSGIRSLLSLTFLSLVSGFFFEGRVWMRVVLFVATVPITIIADAGRVTLTGVLTEYKPELAEGFFHAASGWVIFMIALATLLAFHQALRLGLKVIDVRRK